MRRAAILLVLAACDAHVDDRVSIVTAPRVLAVVAEPPEARPGEPVTLSLLVAGPDGTLPAADAAWELCLAGKPLAEVAPVAAACVDAGPFAPVGTGAAVVATLPTDACRLFGPDTPDGDLRPRDPDATGGYYQPVRVAAFDELAFALPRLRCNLANAPVEVVQDFAARYQPNANPTLEAPPPVGPVAPGATVTLEARWPATSAETYLALDPATQTLVDRREALRVSWFASAGAFAADRTGRGEDDLATATTNIWTAPDAPGPVHVWIVLRDARGGTAWTSYDVDVR